jgi:hypothetical protein
MNTYFAFPEMLVPHIKTTNLKIPEKLDDYDPEEYPHWHVYLNTHLGYCYPLDVFTYNAEIISAIPEEKTKNVTIQDLINLGCSFDTVNPD